MSVGFGLTLDVDGLFPEILELNYVDGSQGRLDIKAAFVQLPSKSIN
jgi:hypothetical protein